MRFEHWRTQSARWPACGRVILAHHDEESVIVYQAFRPEIARYAVEHGRFGDGFSLSRMSWIKPNFLWMMHRSSWGTAPEQEAVLAIQLRRDAFDTILARAVPSSFDPAAWPDRAAWQRAVAAADVRVQWDPDHDPGGRPLDRRAIQLGLRGETLRAYAQDWTLGIADISPMVAVQRDRAREDLETPREDVYVVRDPDVAARLGIDPT